MRQYCWGGQGECERVYVQKLSLHHMLQKYCRLEVRCSQGNVTVEMDTLLQVMNRKLMLGLAILALKRPCPSGNI